MNPIELSGRSMFSERIAAAAIREGGTVYTGAHHHQIIRYMVPMLKIQTVTGEQGFITNTNRYVDRKEAAIIALAAEQIKQDQLSDGVTLFSEYLWSVPDWVFVPGSGPKIQIDPRRKAPFYCPFGGNHDDPPEVRDFPWSSKDALFEHIRTNHRWVKIRGGV